MGGPARAGAVTPYGTVALLLISNLMAGIQRRIGIGSAGALPWGHVKIHAMNG